MAIPVAAVLANIRLTVPIDTSPFDQGNEWLQLRSQRLADYDLFQKLRFQWPQLVGPHGSAFALVLCKTPPNAGVWLHHLSDANLQRQYAAGCFEVAVWGQKIGLEAFGMQTMMMKK